MNLAYTPQAKKQLSKLDKSVAKRLIIKINSLSTDNYPPESKKLKNLPAHRLRVGDYRVIYNVNYELNTLTIIKIAHRRQVYRRSG